MQKSTTVQCSWMDFNARHLNYFMQTSIIKLTSHELLNKKQQNKEHLILNKIKKLTRMVGHILHPIHET